MRRQPASAHGLQVGLCLSSVCRQGQRITRIFESTYRFEAWPKYSIVSIICLGGILLWASVISVGMLVVSKHQSNQSPTILALCACRLLLQNHPDIQDFTPLVKRARYTTGTEVYVPRTPSYQYATPLHLAAAEGSLEAVTMLLATPGALQTTRVLYGPFMYSKLDRLQHLIEY